MPDPRSDFISALRAIKVDNFQDSATLFGVRRPETRIKGVGLEGTVFEGISSRQFSNVRILPAGDDPG